MKRESAYIVNYGSLSVGEHEFEINLSDEFFSRFTEGEIKCGDCKVTILGKKHHSFLELEVSINGEVIVQCDRCLEDLSMPIEFNSRLIIKFSADINEPEFEINEEEEDIIHVNVNDTSVDLTQYLFDSINLYLPLSRIHEEDEDGESNCNADMLAMFIKSE